MFGDSSQKGEQQRQKAKLKWKFANKSFAKTGVNGKRHWVSAKRVEINTIKCCAVQHIFYIFCKNTFTA